MCCDRLQAQGTLELVVQRPRMAVVYSHPLCCVSFDTVLGSQRLFGGNGLQFVGQGVVVSSVLIVKETSHLAYKIHGIQSHITLDNICTSDFTRSPGSLAHPRARVKISQPSRGVFYVRLEMKDGIPVLSQPSFGKLGQFLMQK